MSGLSARRIALVLTWLAFAAGPAVALPYWIAWEGNDWPENQGWTRDIYAGGDVRTLADGVMTLDGMNTNGSWDAYVRYLSGALDPDPDELFIMRWRMRVNAVGNPPQIWDPLVGVVSDHDWMLSLIFSHDQVQSEFEYSTLHFAPDEYHTYEVRTEDMRTYTLWLDGERAWTGSFVHTVGTSSMVGWGDGVYPSRSSSSWDYVAFGVVPEPSSVLLVTGAGIVAVRVHRE